MFVFHRRPHFHAREDFGGHKSDLARQDRGLGFKAIWFWSRQKPGVLTVDLDSRLPMLPTAENNEEPVEFDPFAGPEIDCTIPTTEAQREVLTAAEISQDASCAYNESVSLVLTGILDQSALETAVQQLVARHESLRATLSANDLQMIVSRTGGPVLEYIDLSGHDAAGRERELKAVAEADMTLPFDLRTGPLFRVRLIRLAPDQHQVRLTAHHVICDGWSFGVLMAELGALYTAAHRRIPAALPPAVPFSQYASAVLGFSEGSERETVEAFWLRQFQGTLPRMDLPTDHPRTRRLTFQGRRLDVEMPPELVRGLKETAIQGGTTLVTTLLATFELLLHQLTGATDLVVGLPAAGQSDRGMKHLVGHCVNLLALRSQIDADRTFLEHLKDRRSGMLDAFEHQRYTFGTLVRKLRVPREPGRVPLVPVVFNVDMNIDDGVAFDGLTHRVISNPRRFENFDLFLNATGNERRLVLEWSYKTELFEESTVRDWIQEFLRLAARIAQAPGATLDDLLGDGLLTTRLELPPASWTGTIAPYPRDTSIGDLLDEVAARYPARVALELGEERLDYRTLQGRVHALSARLTRLGVQRGDPVGLCFERSFDLIVSMLAVLRSGGCFVPFDPTYPQKRLQFMLEDTQVRVLLTQSHLRDRLPAHSARIVLPEDREGAETAAGESTAAKVGVTAEDAAYIMYTSGSTGIPKGVVVPHRAIVRLVRSQNFLPFGPELTFLQISNLSFDASTLEIWGALLNGGRLVLQPQPKPTLQEIAQTLRTCGVTTVWFTAGLFNLMVDQHLEDLRGLKHILAGGDVLSVPHVRRAFKVLGPGVLINGYGPTENTTFTCCHVLREEPGIAESIPIGRPIHNTVVYILDADRNPVAIGRKGELYTGGDGLALGYWRRDDLTRESFLPDPFTARPGARMYRTGDLVRWRPDGTIEFIGRVDRQIKERGFRIELGEIEAALDNHPGIRDRAVEVLQNARERQIVGYLVPKQASAASDPVEREALIRSVQAHLRESLPAYMVPSAFVALPAFPLTPNGKLDRQALPTPASQAGLGPVQYEAPRTEIESGLVGLWEKLLGRERIGIHDDFFDLGGHSLVAIQLLSQVEQKFGRKLSLEALFEAPSIARLALLIRNETPRANWPNLALLQPEGQGIPLFCIHGDAASHHLSRYLGPTRPFYAFLHQGRDGDEIRLKTVEEIAASYVRQLREARPKGPYYLSGYSFGGILAFEMAQLLIAQGDAVPLLVMLDTYAPSLHFQAIKSDLRFYEPYLNWLKLAVVRWHLHRKRSVPARLRSVYTIDIYDRAVTNYHPRTYAGRVTILKAEGSWGPRELGWRELATGGVDVKMVPGNHYEMINEPNIAALSRVLSTILTDTDEMHSFDGA